MPAIGTEPTEIIFLTCDATGVLPPISKLSPDNAKFFFISGYTSKVAGTEMGIDEPQMTFSSCFGEPFLVWHPATYGNLLVSKMKKSKCNVWLLNLFEQHTAFKLDIPLNVDDQMDVPNDLLFPINSRKSADEYYHQVDHLYQQFRENLKNKLGMDI